MKKKGKRLTHEDLANLYDDATRGGRPARTLPIDTVQKWAERQTGFFYDEDDFLCMEEK